MSEPTPACQADMKCYRNDGHDGPHAYPDGTTREQADALQEARRAALDEAIALVSGEPYWPRLGAVRRKRVIDALTRLRDGA